MVAPFLFLFLFLLFLEAAFTRGCDLGASRVGGVVTDDEGSYQVMADPEGNEFCFVHL